MERVGDFEPRSFALAPSYYDNDPWTCQTVDLLYGCVIATCNEDMTKDEALEKIEPVRYSYYGIGTEDTLMAVGALTNPSPVVCPKRKLIFLATAEAYRRLHLGYTLLDYVESVSAAAGFESIWLEASTAAMAAGFYQGRGYYAPFAHKDFYLVKRLAVSALSGAPANNN